MAIDFKSIKIAVKQNLPRLSWQHYIAALIVLSILLSVYFSSLRAVWQVGDNVLQGVWQDPYIYQVISFSLTQASLSALLSLIIGLLFARAFFYQSFKGKSVLLRLFSLTFVLPSLVAIFGILGVYGASGWLGGLSKQFAFSWTPSIYGLTGILIAHLFFNIPLATRLFLQAYQSIPYQQHQLAAQINLRGWQFIRWIELPYLKQQILPVFIMIFMLCFTSFAIVLVLGGGPKYTTLEVAIYQAIIFDFDLPKAVQFALLQFVFCILLFLLSSWFSPTAETQLSQRSYWVAHQSKWVQYWQITLIFITSLFLLLPLMNIVISAVSSEAILTAWKQVALWKAVTYSMSIAPLSALASVVMAISLLLASRRLYWLGFQRFSDGMIHFSLAILAIPMLLLAMGLFLWLREWDFTRIHLFILLIFCNSVMALPFVIRILASPMKYNLSHYEKLCQSLGITGWQRFKLIEWHSLSAPMKYAFALACCLSLGDFTAIALFGNQDFSSLPYLLYQQLGSYRGDESAVTALILLLSCLGLFYWLEKHKHNE
ncbi:thiamine/thiamine pyrophosphate ABC transporter permease ThiP [Pasteurellaceae bacterium 22721_9_1]